MKKLRNLLMIVVAFSSLFIVLFTAFDLTASETIFRPGPGLNDGSDNGSINAGKDTLTAKNNPSGNYGSSPYISGLPQSECNIATNRAYIQFDLTSLPADVQQVFLGVTHVPHTSYCYSNCAVDFYFYPVNQPWNEMTLTWDTMPSQDSAVYGPIPIAFPNDFGNREYDITNIYRNWKNGSVPNYGLSIYSPNVGCNNAAVMFYIHSSDDPDETLRPYLKIVVPSRNFLPFIVNGEQKEN